MSNLFFETSRIRSFSKELLTTSNSVSINWDKVNVLLDKINGRENKINTLTNNDRLPLEKQIGLLLLYGSVHYCFTNPVSGIEYSYQNNGKKFFRSTAFITALKNSSINWQDFNEVSQIGKDEWYTTLQTDKENELFQIEKRYDRITQLAQFLIDHDIINSQVFLESIHSAEELISLLLKSGLFQDVFLKRAQVTAYLLSATLVSGGRKPYSDINLLTGMPDYRLPQLLYNQGVINLSVDLHTKLVNKIRVIAESPEERSLRAAVVIIVEYISMILNKPECVVDSLLWGITQEELNLGNMNIPAMLVETDCY